MRAGHRARLVVAAALLGLTACTGSLAAPAAPPAGTGSAAPDEVAGTLTVLAAASLTDVFTRFGGTLEDRYPGLDVRFTFAGSPALATQIAQGAPADVFASADEAQMARVTDAGLAGDPRIFGHNVLMVAVPLDNPGKVTGLQDFAREDLDLAVCAPEVPCGAAAQKLFEALDVAAVPDTYEDDVRAVLTKVRLGEVDAGLVYYSDVVAAGDTVRAIAFPEARIAENQYPIAALTDAPNPAAARAFVDLVLSAEGQQVLADAGFFDK